MAARGPRFETGSPRELAFRGERVHPAALATGRPTATHERPTADLDDEMQPTSVDHPKLFELSNLSNLRGAPARRNTLFARSDKICVVNE